MNDPLYAGYDMLFSITPVEGTWFPEDEFERLQFLSERWDDVKEAFAKLAANNQVEPISETIMFVRQEGAKLFFRGQARRVLEL